MRSSSFLHRMPRGAAAVVLLTALMWADAPPASGETRLVTDVGWWTRRPGAQPLAPGSFEVATEPRGWLSVAALRVDTSRVVGSVTLELTEASAVGPGPALQVCATGAGWGAANPGAAADAPAGECAGAVEMQESSAGVWRADITALAGAGSFLVRPTPVSGAGVVTRPAWQATFSGARLVDVTFAAPTTAAPVPASPAPAPAPAAGGGTAGGFLEGSLGGASGGPFLTAVPSSPVGLPAPIDLPDDPQADSAIALPAPAGEIFSPPLRSLGAVPGSGPDRPWGRLWLLVPGSAATGIAIAWLRRAGIDRGVVASS